tara:strand:+ start:43 stop:150 length:108 start_codon:yes stop_codon:yes gene_type:complete
MLLPLHTQHLQEGPYIMVREKIAAMLTEELRLGFD